MPIFKATIRIRDDALADDQNYSFNVHISESGTSDQAWEDANEIAEALVGTVLPETCNVYSIGINNPDVVNGQQTRAVDLPGTRTVTGQPIPGWNVARVQFRASDGSRPSTFYLRMGLTEDDIVGQNLAAATNTVITSFINAFLLQGHACAPGGGVFETGGNDGAVHMRQMGWRRRTRIGFHRGWVPNT